MSVLKDDVERGGGEEGFSRVRELGEGEAKMQNQAGVWQDRARLQQRWENLVPGESHKHISTYMIG